MTDKNETQEVDEALDLPEVADGEEDTTDWKAEAQKLQQKAIKQRERTKDLKAKIKANEEALASLKPKEEKEKQKDPSEPDYARLAFLEQRGLTHPDDQKLVQDEAIRLKLPLTDVLGMEHIKFKLSAAKDQREAQDGMPKGRGKAGGKSQQDVDYWLAKGETPDDQELAEKVIEARIKKDSKANKFSDELYTG